jgi:3-hydroxyisobutyrate dehydrogenase-like beta-hydroxyacid dehydrogenase
LAARSFAAAIVAAANGNAAMGNGKPAIAFIGFGEAGQAIAAGLRDADAAEMAAWDILFPRAEGMSLRRAAQANGVRCAISAADAVKDAEIVVSAVTAASSLEAAQSVKTHLTGNPLFLDINSVSPGRKQDAAKLLGDKARYLDVAVLAPIHPARHQTPMLLGGPHSKAAEPVLAALGMRTSIAGAETGAAAAIKMVRSVMIKGIEALTLECFLAAARAGVIDEVAVFTRVSIGRRSCPTIWSGWRPTANGAPPRWRKRPPRCANWASSRS